MRALGIAALVIAALPADASGAEIDFVQELKAANALADEGEFAEAKQSLLALLREVRTRGGDRYAVAATLNNIGALCTELGQYRETERYLREAVKIHEGLAGADNPSLLPQLHNLAIVYLRLRRPSRAEALSRRALDLIPRWPGRRPDTEARLLTALAQAQYLRERFKAAERTLMLALDIFEATSGNDAEHADALDTLAKVYAGAGRAREALGVQRRAVSMWERSLGREHPRLVLGLTSLAEQYARNGCRAEGVKHYRRALRIAGERLGEAHPDTGRILEGYAALLRKMGRKGEARQMKRKANRILAAHRRENLLGHSVDVSEFRSGARAKR